MSVAVNSSPAGALNQAGCKRRASLTEDEGETQAEPKRPRYSWYFTLERESPVRADEDDEESSYSVQGYVTEFARDTTDTSTHTWVSDSNDEYEEEFEVDSEAEEEDSYASMTSSSEPENILAVELISFSDSEGMADDSDISWSSTDMELRRSAFTTCVQCQNPNNDSLYQYCRKCYENKKAYFPRPRRKTRPGSQASRTTVTTTTTLNSTTVLNSQELSEMDSGIGSSHCDLDLASTSQELDNRSPWSSGNASAFDSHNSETPMSESQSTEELMFESQGSSEMPLLESQGSQATTTSMATMATLTRVVASQDIDELDSGVSSKNEQSSSQESVGSLKQDGSLMSRSMLLENQELSNKRLCVICFENERNTSFHHGKIGHLCCCNECAKKVWKTNHKRCPICNLKAITIVRQYRD